MLPVGNPLHDDDIELILARLSDNPYVAAQRFLEKNDLPTEYIDQVVNFIEKNTQGVQLGSNSGHVDPFTG